MIFDMHCRLTYPTHDSTCSSFLFAHSNCPLSYDDQIPSIATLPRRLRRLEDPVINYASNYYVINPRQTSHSPSPLPPLSSSEERHIYCDLFNLLDSSPPPPIKQRKKNISNNSNSSRQHRSIVYKNVHTKIKDINERKRYHHQQKQQTDQLQEKTKNNKPIYQQQLSSGGFFRRVVRNYFCVPMTLHNEKFPN